MGNTAKDQTLSRQAAVSQLNSIPLYNSRSLKQQKNLEMHHHIQNNLKVLRMKSSSLIVLHTYLN